MNNIVLIITQNQENSIEKMIDSTQGFERIWIVDRSKDNSVKKLFSLNENYFINEKGFGFLAGKMRDIGIDYILTKKYDNVIMLDGDRIPLNLTQELIEEEMNKSDCSIGFCEKDIRQTKREYKLKKPYEKLMTAGIIIKCEILKKIRNLQFMDNRCFHEEFDGEYGEEDYFLGDCLNYINAKVIESKLLVSGNMPSSHQQRCFKNLEVRKDLIKRYINVRSDFFS